MTRCAIRSGTVVPWTLPPTPALRREQIKLQVALIVPIGHVKGLAAPETRAAAEQARLLIEQAEALGEAPEDPLLLFSVLLGSWNVTLMAFDGNAVREHAVQFLARAEERFGRAHGSAAPRLQSTPSGPETAVLLSPKSLPLS
jgi:hypothetical protein